MKKVLFSLSLIILSMFSCVEEARVQPTRIDSEATTIRSAVFYAFDSTNVNYLLAKDDLDTSYVEVSVNGDVILSHIIPTSVFAGNEFDRNFKEEFILPYPLKIGDVVTTKYLTPLVYGQGFTYSEVGTMYRNDFEQLDPQNFSFYEGYNRHPETLNGFAHYSQIVTLYVTH